MRPPRLSFPIERVRLDNGLRVVLSPDRSAPVVAVAVYYDVGFRSEPEGSTGFAHLFEHMMFQGSANVGKMEHGDLVMGNGGVLNGSTSLDFTNYYEALPSSALELALFLEADRMRSLALTQENLDNQIDVVKEEVRVNVLNRPYGGFPWIWMSDVLFDTFPNAHNGYGSFVDLEAATLEAAGEFFDRYYAPGNAVLTIVGDFDSDEAAALIERHFGDIPARPAPPVRSFSEPIPTEPRRATRTDPHAPTPAAAVAYRMPDPVAGLPEVLALEVLAEVLTGNEAAPLWRRLVRDEGIATAVSAYLGTFGGSVGPSERDPSRFQLVSFYPDRDSLDAILAAIDEEAARVAAEPDPDAIARAVREMTGSYLRSIDGFMSRALTMAPLELHRGRAEQANELPALLAAVTPEAVAEASGRWLDPQRRAVLEIEPGGAS
jgi:predicted Zn-dependent peptidase